MTKTKHNQGKNPNDRLLVTKRYAHKTLKTLDGVTLLGFSHHIPANIAADRIIGGRGGGGMRAERASVLRSHKPFQSYRGRGLAPDALLCFYVHL